MALAEILDSNPQEFIMEAYSDPLKYYPPGKLKKQKGSTKAEWPIASA